MAVPRCGNTDAALQQKFANRRRGRRQKRWAKIKDVPLWTDPEHGFTLPLTIGFRDYSTKMAPAEQESALLYCASVSIFITCNTTVIWCLPYAHVWLC